jgi:hypothetical protein
MGLCSFLLLMGKNMVVKIACSSSEVILRTRKYTMIYPGSGTFLKVIALSLMA